MKRKIILCIIGVAAVCVIGFGIGYKIENKNASSVKSNVVTTSKESHVNKSSNDIAKNTNNPKKDNTSSNNTNVEQTSAVSTKNSSYNNSNNGANWTYATSSEIDNLKGQYSLMNVIKKSSDSDINNDLTGISISDNEVQLTNDINGNYIYSTSDRMKVYNLNSNEFLETFGESTGDFGLTGSSFKVYAAGDIFIYELQNGNIVISYKDFSSTALNDTLVIKPVDVSNWYGSYKVGKEIQGTGSNPYNLKPENLTGKQILISKNEFRYGDKVVDNPNYYFVKVNPESYFNNKYADVDLINGEAYFLAVMSDKYPMTNQAYVNLKNYIGCQSGAWLAGIAMPIILGPNGNIQAMNNIQEIYNVKNID